MRVSVLYFGVLKDFFEGERDVVEVAPGTPVSGLLELLRGGAGAGQAGMWTSVAVAVNREYAGRGTVLQEGDEVALLPPVSGGCGAAEAAPPHRPAGQTGGYARGGLPGILATVAEDGYSGEAGGTDAG